MQGYGLAKLLRWHPEVVDDLQGQLEEMAVESQNENTVQLDSATHHAVVSLNWKGADKKWLLTQLEKKCHHLPRGR
jgi:hypothetical protein